MGRDKHRARAVQPVSERDRCMPELTQPPGTFGLFTEGDELYRDMLASISGARGSIDLESYIFADDEIGRLFAEALVGRAAHGVRVRVHIDAAGSLFWMSRRLERYLRGNGVSVRWFHRWSWRRPGRYNRRNHRKLLVVDGRRAYVGGFNIHRESSASAYGDLRWRDTHVSIDGSLARTAAALFDAFWRGRLRWQPPDAARGGALVHNHNRRCRHRLRCIYEDILLGARRYAYLTTPYFVPDHRTQNALAAAARRGVDVRLLVPRKSDVPVARWASRHAYSGLLGAGVRIHEYLPRLLHAKTAVADDSWAMVGTANLDYRSLFTNYELNLVARDASLASRLRECFVGDLGQSEQVAPDQWDGRGWPARMSEAVGWTARRWL